MLGKFISRGAQFHSAAKASAKFPEGTTAGLYKAAVAARPDYDAVRFDSQGINWTLKELDVSRVAPPVTSLPWTEIQFGFGIRLDRGWLHPW